MTSSGTVKSSATATPGSALAGRPSVWAPPKSIAKRILFVLFEGLPASVIDTQVPLHVRAAQAALAARFEVSGWPKNPRALAGRLFGSYYYRTSQSAASKRKRQSGNSRATIGIGRGSRADGTRMKRGARDPCQAESR
jgi:hypothetical protein